VKVWKAGDVELEKGCTVKPHGILPLITRELMVVVLIALIRAWACVELDSMASIWMPMLPDEGK
jgi:hypothetical protein